MTKKILASEMPLNQDGSIYHLNLLPTDIAETIFLVGDPERVPRVSQFFDSVEIKKSKREFVTHTGHKNGKKLTVISTGIGTDNIDITLNELDALVNIDLETREIKDEKTSLNLIRLGTSGSVNPDIDAGSFVKSKFSVGFDGLTAYYPEHQDNTEIKKSFLEKFPYPNLEALLYFTQGSESLFQKFGEPFIEGNTGTLGGFYGAQGRQLRLKSLSKNLLDEYHLCGLDNFEMETAGIYALSQLLGHQALSINCIIANRTTGRFLDNYKQVVDDMIEQSLQIVSSDNF